MTEILAPCGSPEVLTAVLRAGCDGVYLGGESFSARQNAVNFSDGEIERAVYECHKRGVKLYRTINTIVFDEQLDQLLAAVKHSAEVGVDGLITQDPALVEAVKACCPELPIHASTQMTVHTADGVDMTKRLGFKRTVLARELPLDIIRELSSRGIETEVFIHGALCMSVSGQCYMSAVVGSRSANRGLCAQACRLPCSAVSGRKDRYDLSLKDLSGLDYAPALRDAGVASLKIEGRMKRPEYGAMAVDCCKKALDGESYDRQTLADVFSRGGFTDGYLTHRLGRDMFGFRSRDDVQASAKALPKIHELYRSEDKRSSVNFALKIKSGEPALLTACDDNGITVSVSGDIPQPSVSRPADSQSAVKQLSKLGDTIYTLGKADCDIGEGLFISPSALNAMRREVCAALDKKRAQANTHRAEFVYKDLLDFEEAPESGSAPTIRVSISRPQQLGGIDPDQVELCAVPLRYAVGAAESFDIEKLAVLMPRFTFDEAAQKEQLKLARAAGIKKMYASNIAHIKAAEELGFELHLDYGFNLSNSAALNAVKKLGAKDAVVSFELKAPQIGRLKKPLPIGIFAYGRLPLMLTVNCPISQAVGCKNCKKQLCDRTGRVFKVRCSKSEGYVEVLNSDVLYLADRLGEFSGISFLQLCFTDEGSDEVRRIIGEYERGSAAPRGITRGLYFRGVL